MLPLLAALLHRIPRRGIWVLLSLSVIGIIAGAALFSHFEHRSLFTGLYWAVTTATTVGYGDVTPSNAVGRVIAMGVMLTVIPLIGALFAVVSAHIVELKMRRLLGMDTPLPQTGHTVILGFLAETKIVLSELLLAREPVVVVANLEDGLLPSGVPLVKGDPAEEGLLERAHVTRAKQALVTAATDGEVLEIAIAVRHLAPHLPLIVSTRSEKVSRALHELGVPLTVSTDDLLGHTLAKSLEAPHAAQLLLRIVNSDAYRIEERPVQPDWVGLPLSEVRSRHGGFVLGVAQQNDVILGVERDPVMAADSSLLVLAPRRDGELRL
ncbi:MAG: potassium channel family protein [Bacilli bacterium]